MFDFPNSPTIGQQVIEPNGAVVQWDGTKWASVAGQVNSVAPLYNNVGRNFIHNSMFNIQQRGAGPFTTIVYTADRWGLYFTGGDTNSITLPVAADVVRTTIGDESCQYILQNVITGSASASAFTVIYQLIENVRRLANKTVTISFWAQASTTGLKIGVLLRQSFGTGGSPSPLINLTPQTVSLTTGFARYSLTFIFPSIAGKTFGTNNNDNVEIDFYLSSGANNNSFAGGIGVQSGTFWLWGVQLEIGSTMTPLEKLDPRIDLANCQRFYQTGRLQLYSHAGAGSTVAQSVLFPVVARATPTLTTNFTNTANGTGQALAPLGAFGLVLFANAVASGTVQLDCIYTASADL